MGKSILLLSGRNILGKKEDLFLLDYFADEFDLAISYLDEHAWRKKKYDLVLVRCIWTWPSDEEKHAKYSLDLQALRRDVQKLKLKTYNSSTGRGDMTGKDYLVSLFNAGYPAIPTIDSLDNLPLLGLCDMYIVKPKTGLGAQGVKSLSKGELLKLHPKNVLIQPLVPFTAEVSFYYIDNEFQYALEYKPKKAVPAIPAQEFEPSAKDMAFARKFVDWNTLEYGIQRIDALRLKDGRLLLLEIEDFSQRLDLPYLKNQTKKRFLNNLRKSIRNVLRR